MAKKELTEEQKEELKAKEAEAKKYALLESVANSEGGKMLILGFQERVVNAIDKLRTGYKTMPESELRGWCAALDERVTLLFAFQRASINRKVTAEDLAAFMKSIDDENE